MFRELIPALNVAPGTRQEVIDEILEIANPNDERTVAAIWRATVSTDVTGLAAAVTCPVFVANGEFDGTFTPEAGTRMASASGGEFESMPGVGHLPMFEDPELTASLVSRFLRQNEGGADDS
jgi:pimeloyl-ACP methyl ester carboxylesterase